MIRNCTALLAAANCVVFASGFAAEDARQAERGIPS